MNKWTQENLKINKHNFPSVIVKFLNLENQLSLEKATSYSSYKSDLKTFYKSRFQKGNRWNQTMIRKGTVNYSAKELNQLLCAFGLLFHEDKHL